MDAITRKKILETHMKTLRKLPNVVGGGVGKRIKNGITTDEDVVHVFVREKVSSNSLNPNQIIPKKIWTPNHQKSVGIDVIKIGNVTRLSNQNLVRPIIGGLSIGNINESSAGTLGGIFKDLSDNEPVMLSNNHVLARQNKAALGEHITQPSQIETDPAEFVATLKKFITIQPQPQPNSVDAAIAGFIQAFASNNDIAISNIGAFHKTRTAAISMPVQKSGRSLSGNPPNEYRTGTITSLGATVFVTYDFGDAMFTDQIITTNMLVPGDSGSLLLTMRNEVVGLGFAGSSDIGVFSPIAAVLSALNINLYSPQAISVFQDPYHGGYFYKPTNAPDHDPLFTKRINEFLLYQNDFIPPGSTLVRRWKTTTYPVKYAIGASQPGAGYSVDIDLGYMSPTPGVGRVALYEWTDSSRDFRFYTTDASGGHIDTDRFSVNPSPVGYVQPSFGGG